MTGSNLKYISAVVASLSISFVLNVIGINWGRSGYVPWQPDSIEGVTIVNELPKTFEKWTYKYPRGYFVINGIFYKPIIDHWKKHPEQVRTSRGKVVNAALTTERLEKLAQITRWITIVLAGATVLAVMLTAAVLFRDKTAAILAGLSLAVMQLFVFYSSSGCVDVPAMAFYAFSGYFAVKAIYHGKWRHYLGLGFCVAYAVCTKEGIGVFLLGLVFGMWGLMFEKAESGKGRAGQGRGDRGGTKSSAKRTRTESVAVLSCPGETAGSGCLVRNCIIRLKQAVLLIISVKILAAVVVCALVFGLLNGFSGGSGEFLDRVSHWKVVTEGFLESFKGHSELLWRSCRQLYQGLGWPLLAVVLGSTVYFSVRHRWKLLFTAGPLVFFYLITVVNIHFNAPRFMLPGYVGLAILIGKGSADWLRCRKIPAVLRISGIVLVFGLSFLYCLGLVLETANDTRERAEKWVHQHVNPKAVIGAAMPKGYAPRLHYQGYRQISNWHSEGVRIGNRKIKFYPDYLIVSTDWPCLSRPTDPEFRKKLFKGKTNYRKVADFQVKYLPPNGIVFGLAGWPTKRHSRISPRMIIFEKDTGANP